MKYVLVAVASALTLAGCQPVDTSLAGRWRVQQIAGASLGEGVEIWMTFDIANETVSGFTACNEFAAPLNTFGDAFTIGAISEGEGECGSMAAATDEQRLLLVLPQVQRRILRGKSLELLQAASGSETLIRLRREDAVE